MLNDKIKTLNIQKVPPNTAFIARDERTGQYFSTLPIKPYQEFEYDFDENTVAVVETDTKNRKEAILPLRAEMAAILKAYLANKTPKAAVFRMAHRTNTAKMLYKA